MQSEKNLPISLSKVNQNQQTPHWFLAVKSWADSMASKGNYKQITAHLYITALSKICTVLADEPELTSVQSAVGNLEKIRKLFISKTHSNENTVKAYISRIRNVLTEYLSHQISSDGPKDEAVLGNVSAQNSSQLFQENLENITVVDLTKSFLQSLPKCSGELPPELARKLFIHLLPYSSRLDPEAYLEFLLKISKATPAR